MQASDDKLAKGAANLDPKDGDRRAVMDPRRLKRLEDVSKDGTSRLAVFRRTYSSVSLRTSGIRVRTVQFWARHRQNGTHQALPTPSEAMPELYSRL